MNYRHIFHAGNFADLAKHAVLTSILARLAAAPAPLSVIDTHAGAGVYDLTSKEAARSGEAEAGIARLLADRAAPAVFDPLKAAVQKLNPSNGLSQYPGSPWLILDALRGGDRLCACELRPDDFAALERIVERPGPKALHAEALRTDGYAAAPARIQPGHGNLVLIDPPFERGDEYAAVLACVGEVSRRDAGAVIMVWLPLKDLETFDRFLRGLEDLAPPPTLVAEARLRRLDDPMRMNGCALVVINDPPGTEEDARAACDWVVGVLGEAGGQARVWRL
ncbi:MAG TPA: 23S rRNA (adenine(2030)-N(6))-methyltransferase RlmJ [Caulobacteraceae bacterium]|jgi:23S rRNA (adenine2030-N6)-methyltransferase|nr:23S rRNA (adenine(2030)-N(6))-methyltransferase RlmJ [Caulobacteraceae bacterium]